jgi:hypothetical protein
MSRSTYFVQECPTCGRSLQVRVEYLGRQVVCQHCQRPFEACDPASSRNPIGKPAADLLRRADQLLELMQRHGSRPTV